MSAKSSHRRGRHTCQGWYRKNRLDTECESYILYQDALAIPSLPGARLVHC